MGKLANNERRKLRALYYNNVASGLTVIGCVIPLLNVGIVIPRIANALADEGFRIISPENVGLASTLLSAAVALSAAAIARIIRNAIVSKIED